MDTYPAFVPNFIGMFSRVDPGLGEDPALAGSQELHRRTVVPPALVRVLQILSWSQRWTSRAVHMATGKGRLSGASLTTATTSQTATAPSAWRFSRAVADSLRHSEPEEQMRGASTGRVAASSRRLRP